MKAIPASPPAPPRADEVAVLIGRYAPFHHAHLEALRLALVSYRLVVVVLGSAFQAASPKNPFTWEQRSDMISLCLTEAERSRVVFVPARDHHRDDRWADAVSRSIFERVEGIGHRQLTLANPTVDTTAFRFDWPKIFPRWGHRPIRLPARGTPSMDSTGIRSVLFSVEKDARLAALELLKVAVPTEVRHYLSAWWETPLRDRLAQEAEWVRQYRERWPAEQALTCDAVVVCSNHVLLIERGEGAGAGLFAVPGGFLEKNERFYEGARRELREETGLGYIGDGLDVAFVRAEIFDRPDRSLRARIVTVAHFFDLKAIPLPDVQGRDDARRALWLPIAQLCAIEDRFFEDHFQILDFFLDLTRD